MADLSAILRAAPIGLFMLVGSYFAMRRRKTGFSKAKSGYPAIATALGLEHRAVSDPSRIGSIRGTLDGHDVFVDPDERPRLVAYLKGSPPILCRSFELEKRTPQNMVRVDTRDPGFDGAFRERFASEAVAESMRNRAADLGEAVRRVQRAHDGPLASIAVSSERVEVALEMGRPAHVPCETVTAMLPALVAFAKIVEEIGGIGEG